MKKWHKYLLFLGRYVIFFWQKHMLSLYNGLYLLFEVHTTKIGIIRKKIFKNSVFSKTSFKLEILRLLFWSNSCHHRWISSSSTNCLFLAVLPSPETLRASPYDLTSMWLTLWVLLVRFSVFSWDPLTVCLKSSGKHRPTKMFTQQVKANINAEWDDVGF